MANKDLFSAALSEEGVTGSLADVARSIYMQESGGGRNTRTSNAGAMGGMQIIPSTFASVADKGWDITDPMHNARAGIRYLKQLDKQAGGDPMLTAAGYYGGPGGLEKARRGIAVSDPRNPNAPNTLQYGQQVAARLGKPQSTVPSKAQEAAPVQLALVESVPQSTVVDSQLTAVASPQQVAAVPSEWQQFRERMPEQVQAEDLQYGVPNFQLPQMNQRALALNTPEINFRAFRGLRGRS